MRAIARLLLTYFGGTPLLRWVTLLGLAMTLFGTVALLYFSGHLFSGYSWGGTESLRASIAGEAFLWLVPVLGVVALFLGGSLMPTMLHRFALGHYLHVLPYGRSKVIVSALAAVALVALVFAVMVTALYAVFPLGHGQVFGRGFVVSFLSFSSMYLILWFTGRARSAVGLLGGTMLVIVSLALPFRFIQTPATSLRWPLVIGGLVLSSAVAAFLFAPQLWQRVSAQRASPGGSSAPDTARYTGREVEWLIGTARPWILAVGQIFPILVATRFISSPGIWLFYFTLFGAMSGAFASFAAARSRCLWLRSQWSRVQLFGRVEAAFWRHNSYSLGVLMLLLVAIGSGLDFPLSSLALGLPLLMLGTAVSTYLGLMMTRGIGWWDSILAVCAMLLMMVAAIYAAQGAVHGLTVIGCEALLAGLTLAFRAIAKRRWTRLDWMLCRPDAAASARSAY